MVEGVHAHDPVNRFVGDVYLTAVITDKLGWLDGAAENGHFFEQTTAEIKGGLGDINGNGGATHLIEKARKPTGSGPKFKDGHAATQAQTR